MGNKRSTRRPNSWRHATQADLPLAKYGVEGERRHKPKIWCASEDEEQIALVDWLNLKKDIPFYHIPNGGQRDAREGAKLKRMGVSAGAPDLCIPMARKGHHGLYIELKREEGGVLSDAQKKWRDILIKQGYAWYECKGFEHAKDVICYYLDL